MINCIDCLYSCERWQTEQQKSVAASKNWPEHECRFAPPVTAVDADGNELAPWPLVRSTDWCGRGVPKGGTPPHSAEQVMLTASQGIAEAAFLIASVAARNDEILDRTLNCSTIHNYRG